MLTHKNTILSQDSRTEPISICKKYFSKGSYLEYPGGQPPGPPQFTKTRRGSPAFATAPAITVYTSVFSNNVYVRTRNILTNVRNSVILWIRKTKSCSPGRATALPITVYTSVPVTMITHKNTILFVTARLKKLRIRMVSARPAWLVLRNTIFRHGLLDIGIFYTL